MKLDSVTIVGLLSELWTRLHKNSIFCRLCASLMVVKVEITSHLMITSSWINTSNT
jgi:hypothetical protein